MQSKNISFLSIMIILFTFASSANAIPVTINYSGSVDQWLEFSSSDGTGSLGGAVTNGTQVIGSFTYESTDGSIVSASMNIGGAIQYSSNASSFGSVSVIDSQPGVGYDYFEAVIHNPIPQSNLAVSAGITSTALSWMDWQMELVNMSGTAFINSSIPSSVNLADFDNAYVMLRSWFPDNNGDDVSQGAWLIRASVPTAPVPEPSTFLLFGAGFAGIAFLRRRNKQ
jgi:hypothetical protein